MHVFFCLNLDDDFFFFFTKSSSFVFDPEVFQVVCSRIRIQHTIIQRATILYFCQSASVLEFTEKLGVLKKPAK